MKVHPAPNKRNITVRYDFRSQSNDTAAICCQKKLRRLPHIFAKVLELPFYSDADVSIQETSDSFKFVVDTDDDIGTDIAAHTIDIYPGVTKVVVRGTRGFGDDVNRLEVDLWRFRLPESTQPEHATAAFSDGELVVTVPKDVNLVRNQEVWGEGNETGRTVSRPSPLSEMPRIIISGTVGGNCPAFMLLASLHMEAMMMTIYLPSGFLKYCKDFKPGQKQP